MANIALTKKLANKIAVITGGNSGMGLATAKRFVAEGASVFITGRRQKELDAAVKEIGGNVTAVQGDVANLADLDRLYATVRKEKGRIDVLFANAGVGELLAVGSITEAHFDKIMDINVKGTLFTVQKALPLFKNGGSIIMTGSVASIKGFANFSVYNASKAAVRSFARSWTTDLKGRNIRVNVLSPAPLIPPFSTRCPRMPSRTSFPPSRWAASALPMKSPRSPSSSLPTTPAILPASNSSPTAAWRKYDR